jgi:hypothetical protein
MAVESIDLAVVADGDGKLYIFLLDDDPAVAVVAVLILFDLLSDLLVLLVLLWLRGFHDVEYNYSIGLNMIIESDIIKLR